MSYSPYYSTWKDWPDVSTPVTAAAMQHIEAGITAASQASTVTNTGNVVLQSDSGVVGSGDIVLDTGNTEQLRLLNGGGIKASQQITRDDFNVPFGDSTAFLQMRRHAVNPVGQKYVSFLDSQSHGTKTSGDSITSLLSQVEDDSSVASTVKSVTNCANNGSGLIRVTCTGHGFSTNDWIGVYGVTGTTEANNSWQITFIDANTFDLQGSTFTNAYVSGGKATNRPKMFGVAVNVIPIQSRGVVGGIALSNNAANADDMNAFVAYNGSGNNARATTGFIVGKNGSFTGDQWGSAFQIEANVTSGLVFQSPACSAYGIDFVGSSTPSTFGTAAIRLPNNSPVSARNAAGNADVNLFQFSSDNAFHIGASGTPALNIDTSLNVNWSMSIADNVAVALGTTNGTKFGTATSQKIGFFNAAPVVQPNGTGNTHTVTAGSTTNVFINTTFDGSTGSTAYTVGDIVKALKSVGLLAA